MKEPTEKLVKEAAEKLMDEATVADANSDKFWKRRCSGQEDRILKFLLMFWSCVSFACSFMLLGKTIANREG